MVSAVVLLAILAVLINMPPLTECHSEPPDASKQYWVRATQAIAEPWRGQHRVFGIFRIPKQYKFHHLYTVKLIVQGLPVELAAGSPEDEDVYHGNTEQGYYLKQVYIPTRTAFWFLLTGRFGDLRASCHWWLMIADRK